MTKRSIIIDCDPGQDDAIALLLAMASPDELKILGITAVAGNVPLELTEYLSESLRVTTPPGEAVVYSNMAYSLVAHLVEKFSGKRHKTGK